MIIRGRKTNVSVAKDSDGKVIKIKSGMKVWSEAAKRDIPKSLDYFNIARAPELQKMYGEKPNALLISMPSDDLHQCFTDNYVLYGVSKAGNASKIRECNGLECTHRIAENIGGVQYGEGEQGECICVLHGLNDSEDKEVRKKACKVLMNLRAFVLNPQTEKIESTTPYLFESGSINSANAIVTALEAMQSLTTILTRGTARLQHIPFWIRVKMVPSKTDPKAKFPIWEMSPTFASIEAVRNRLHKIGGILGYSEEEMKALNPAAEGKPQEVPAKLIMPAATPVVEEDNEEPVGDDLWAQVLDNTGEQKK